MHADESQLRIVDEEGNANGKNYPYCVINRQAMFRLTDRLRIPMVIQYLTLNS